MRLNGNIASLLGPFPSKGVNTKHIFLLCTQVSLTLTRVWVEIPELLILEVPQKFWTSELLSDPRQLSLQLLPCPTELENTSFIAQHGSEGSYTALTLSLGWFCKQLASL